MINVTQLEICRAREKLLVLDSVDLEPTRRSSGLLLLSLRKLEENHQLSSAKQKVREDGGSVESGLEDK